MASLPERRTAPRLIDRRSLLSGFALTAVGLGATSARGELAQPPELADRILVLKSERKLLLLRGRAVLGFFPVALGRRPIGPKRFAGDLRTPEGLYSIDAVNLQSRFHLALRISYPNAEDVARARAAGLMPGGDIEIHGMPENYGPFDPVAFYKDWTNGCIAVGNRAIEQIRARTSIGTPVEIRA